MATSSPVAMLAFRIRTVPLLLLLGAMVERKIIYLNVREIDALYHFRERAETILFPCPHLTFIYRYAQ